MTEESFYTSLSQRIQIRSEFKNDYILLILNELNENEHRLSNHQIIRLLETAAIFSLSNNDIHKKIALKISFFLLNQYREINKSVPLVVELIITRLGDIPTIWVIKSKSN